MTRRVFPVSFWFRNVYSPFMLMSPKPRSLSQEELMPLLQQTLMSGRDIRALVRCVGFLDCDSRDAQLLFLRESCRLNRGIGANNAFFSYVLGISGGPVAKIVCKARETSESCRRAPQAPGRPLTLTEEQEAAVIPYPRETNLARNFVTRGAVLRFIQANLTRTITDSWLRPFLLRYGGDTVLRVAKPQENPR
jgi:hypothetical protein